LEDLIRHGFLRPSDVSNDHDPQSTQVNFLHIKTTKNKSFRLAFEKFKGSLADRRDPFRKFIAAQKHWLNDYALFSSLKKAHKGAPWFSWQKDIRDRDPESLRAAFNYFKADIEYFQFEQFIYFQQWEKIQSYCHEKNVGIIGDVPIYVAHDSSDVWAHPELFTIKKNGDLELVAGTPPDYFSKTGQRWGNPLYRWDLMKENGYSWWINRLKHLFQFVDAVRLDHFIGFQRYWKIKAQSKTAKNGTWTPGPGKDFFQQVVRKIGRKEIIAEDLGVSGDDVKKLRDQFGFPGMKILHFAFTDDTGSNEYLPHHHNRSSVVYTGTHDNDTTRGWYHKLNQIEKNKVKKYLGVSGKNIAWDLIRTAFNSVASLAIVPMQDVLDLGSDARMNTPGTNVKNWDWKMKQGQLTKVVAGHLLDITRRSGRITRV
jgi:4-alpha-glucanotransferase